MNNYYEEVIKELEILIQEKSFLKAEKILVEELNMPYIPSDFEEALLKLMTQIPQKRNSKPELNFEKLYQLLLNNSLNDFDKFDLIELFNEFNLKKYSAEIEEILLKENISQLIKFKLLEQLKSQGINKKFKVYFDDKINEINLKNIPKLSEDKTFAYNSRLIEEILFKKPVLNNIALIILEQYSLFLIYYQKTVDDLYLSILYIVAKYFKDQELLEIIHKKGVVNIKKQENIKEILNILKIN